MELTTDLFKAHEKQIYASAWEASRRWGIEAEELIAQGYLIFCEAAHRYDPERGATFNTYLYHALRALDDYCRAEVSRNFRAASFDLAADKYESGTTIAWGYRDPEYLPDPLLFDKTFAEFVELMEMAEAALVLSSDARRIVEYILNGEHTPERYAPRPCKMSIRRALRAGGWSIPRFNSAWNEIKNWYQEEIA